MFQRIKDTFAFETECSRWERKSDIRTLLIGNRVAEMLGQSASYGENIDVYCLRDLYYRHRDNSIKQSKQQGMSSQQAVLSFICKIGNLYMEEKGESLPSERILFCLSLLAPSYSVAHSLLDERWKQWLQESEAAARSRYEETRAFMPKLYAARKEAASSLDDRLRALSEWNIPPEFRNLWRAIPNKSQNTERQISEKANLPIADCVSWIEALTRNVVVTVIGTALDEPKFWKTPESTLNDPGRELRNYLDAKFS